MMMPRRGIFPLSLLLLAAVPAMAGVPLPVTYSASAASARSVPAQARATATPKPTSTPIPTATPVPQVLTVTTTADTVPCPKGSGNPGYSLRCAMGLANAVGSGREIRFNIPSTDPGCHPTSIGAASVPVCTIALTRSLNLTASSTTIDGYTQPGASPNTVPVTRTGDDAVLTIRLDGTSMFAGGIVVSNTNGDRIRGLSITNFHNGPAISTSQTNGLLIDGNFIGIAPDGTTQGNAEGIRISEAHDTMLGGSTPDARNQISGSAGFGIAVSQYGLGVTVQGNLISGNGTSGIGIGTDAQGIAIPVEIRQNFITKSGGLGIDVSPGAVSDCQVFTHYTSRPVPCPVIKKVSARKVSGTACKGCLVDLYVASPGGADNGFGEAKSYLGSVVATKGTWTLSLGGKHFDPARQQITATATTSGQTPATSEFALDMPVRLHLKSRKSHFLITRGRLVGVNVTWRMASQLGIFGFDVYAGSKHLNSRFIHVAAAGQYSLKVPLARKAAITLAVTLVNGVKLKVAVPAA